MNSTEKSWTACWTSPGSVLRLINTATGPPRWGPVRSPQRLWFWVRWQFDLSSVVMFVTPLAFKWTLKPDLIYCCDPPQVWMSRIMTWLFRVCLNCSSSRSVRLWPLCRPKSVEVRGHLPSQQLCCVSPTSPCTCNHILALKQLMKRVLERIMDTVVSVEDDDEEEEEEAKQTSTQHHGRVHCSLGMLCDWYSCQTKVRRRSTARVHDLQSAAPKGSPSPWTPSQITEIQQQHTWKKAQLSWQGWSTAAAGCNYFQGFGSFQSQSSSRFHTHLQVNPQSLGE